MVKIALKFKWNKFGIGYFLINQLHQSKRGKHKITYLPTKNLHHSLT